MALSPEQEYQAITGNRFRLSLRLFARSKHFSVYNLDEQTVSIRPTTQKKMLC